MRILLDECVPRLLRRELPDHDVWTVVEMGWSGKKNGELLALMAPQSFAVFLTVDQNISFQQGLRMGGIAIIVLIAQSNRLVDLKPLMPALRSRLDTIKSGELIEVKA